VIVGVGELKTKLGVDGKVVGVGLKSVSGKSRGTVVLIFGSAEEVEGWGWEVDVCACAIVGCVE
jgi:hypothetical protein